MYSMTRRDAQISLAPTPADDAREVVRLAAVMYASMGLAPSAEWCATRPSSFRRDSAEARRSPSWSTGRRWERGLAASGVGLVAVRMPSPNNLDGRVGYIQWVATETAYRRQGMARAVMEALLGWFEQDRSLWWSCTPPRTESRCTGHLALGRRAGWHFVGARLRTGAAPASQLARRVFETKILRCGVCAGIVARPQ